jgi:hypothetical protein
MEMPIPFGKATLRALDNIIAAKRVLQGDVPSRRCTRSGLPGPTRASEQDKQALKQEHARANAFAHELASARAELKAAMARASTAAAAQEQTTQASEQEKRSLEQKRARAEALTRELASARAELEAAKESTSAVAAARVIADQPPEHNERALEQASDRELAPTRIDLESAQASTKAEATQTDAAGVSEKDKRALGQARADTEAAGQLHPAQHGTNPATGRGGGRSAATDRMIERAQKLIALADVNGARLLLERSLALGDERAAFPLAQTYDPRVLSERGLRGGSRRCCESSHALLTRANRITRG